MVGSDETALDVAIDGLVAILGASFLTQRACTCGTNAKCGDVLFDALIAKKFVTRTDISEMSSIMLIKTLTLHSLTYIVGITSSIAVH